MSKGITEKELKLAAKNIKLQYGVIELIINEAKKIRLNECDHDFIGINSSVSDYSRKCKKCKKYFK